MVRKEFLLFCVLDRSFLLLVYKLCSGRRIAATAFIADRLGSAQYDTSYGINLLWNNLLWNSLPQSSFLWGNLLWESLYRIIWKVSKPYGLRNDVSYFGNVALLQ